MSDTPQRLLSSCTTIVIVMAVFLILLVINAVIVFGPQLGGL